MNTPAPAVPSVEGARERLAARCHAWRLNGDSASIRFNIGDVRTILSALATTEARLADALAAMAEARAENDTMRGILANSALDCVYCGLPAADMGKCVSGFPGCARADDINCTPPPLGKETV